MKTLSDFNFKNKKVLLRVDINSDFVNGKILISERIRKSAESIKQLKKKKAAVVIIAHQGRFGKKDFSDLKQHAKLLNKFVKIKYIDDILGKKAFQAIENLKSGEAILLENIRSLEEESKPGKNKLVKKLAPLFDIYVNDAFSVCHRNQTSIVSFPKYLLHCAGKNLMDELKALKKIKMKNCLYILGGGKPEDNIRLLKGNKILACGFFGQACLIAKGKNLGMQNKILSDKLYLKKELKRKLKNVVLPVDFALKVNGKRKEISLEEFPSKYEIFDIGEKTIKLFIKEIKKAKSIYMKGPAGFASEKQFAKGTNAILQTVAKHKNKGFTLIGGGHLSDAIKNSGISKKKFGYVSLSGGALARYVAGEKLPGLEALK